MNNDSITNLDLLRNNINQIIDCLQSQQILLNKHDQSIDWLVMKVQQQDYLASRNQELEFRENPYSFDGEANCNS